MKSNIYIIFGYILTSMSAFSNENNTSSESEEEIQKYIFYCYHTALLMKDTDTCSTCDRLSVDNKTLEKIHEDFDEDCDEALNNISCYVRQMFYAYIYPSTYKKYVDETNDDIRVEQLYCLANLCQWNTWDDRFEELSDMEYVEDAYNDAYICYVGDSSNEQDVFKYFNEHNIHMSFEGSAETNHAEWHVKGKHIS